MSEHRKLRSFKRLKGIIVLSLFDGMSCGQLALERVGLNVETYYASEVDKYAMQVTQHNYPDTIQIGSVVDITIERLGKFEILLNGKYIIDTRKLIIIGGSPCQGFSFAGTMVGSSTECNIDVTTLEQYLDLKSTDFKFKGQSYLFWEYIRVTRAAKPMYYFLENVKMVKKWEGMFNDAMSHEPIKINSALVSAQNRVRLYWTNIPDVTQPEDRGILIKDILQDSVDEKYYLSRKGLSGLRKHRRRHVANGNGFGFSPKSILDSKTHTLITTTTKSNSMYFIDSFTNKVRRGTPIECKRLQTVPDNYTDIVSNSQRYKMLGNGWTIDVPAHIFKGLKR